MNSSTKAKRFFFFDPDRGLTFTATAEEAKTGAEKTLDEYRDIASDEGWIEGVEDVCWGEVKQKVKQTSKKDRPDDSALDEDMHDENGTYWGHEFAYIAAYDLEEI